MADINYKEVTLVFPNGEKFATKSTMDQKEYLLDTDFRTHPAWTKTGEIFISKAKKIDDFNAKFAGFSSFISEE